MPERSRAKETTRHIIIPSAPSKPAAATSRGLGLVFQRISGSLSSSFRTSSSSSLRRSVVFMMITCFSRAAVPRDTACDGVTFIARCILSSHGGAEVAAASVLQFRIPGRGMYGSSERRLPLPVAAGVLVKVGYQEISFFFSKFIRTLE